VVEAARVILLLGVEPKDGNQGQHARTASVRSIITVALLGCLAFASHALAQDVPGIENCMAEKQIERRTGCLQSNINFLKTQITTEAGKAKADAQARLDDAGKQIDALKLLVAGLQSQLKQVQADLADVKAKAAPNHLPNEPPSK
jgi:hypothetical protein